MYLGLHVGEVFYGNIGSKERLDFTIVGPAVNEVSRIASMCRSVDQPLLVSSAFAAALGESRSRLVSVGRYALRGVAGRRICSHWRTVRTHRSAMNSLGKTLRSTETPIRSTLRNTKSSATKALLPYRYGKTSVGFDLRLVTISRYF